MHGPYYGKAFFKRVGGDPGSLGYMKGPLNLSVEILDASGHIMKGLSETC